MMESLKEEIGQLSGTGPEETEERRAARETDYGRTKQMMQELRKGGGGEGPKENQAERRDGRRNDGEGGRATAGVGADGTPGEEGRHHEGPGGRGRAFVCDYQQFSIPIIRGDSDIRGTAYSLDD